MRALVPVVDALARISRVNRKLVVAVALAFVALSGLGLVRWVQALEQRVESRFQGRLFAIPSQVFGAPLELRRGADATRVGLLERLGRLGYRIASDAELRPGEYRRQGSTISIERRSFRHAGSEDPGGRIEVRLDAAGRISSLSEGDGRRLDSAWLEPERIARFRGPEGEDRVLVTLDEVPAALVEAILAVEDQRFFEHEGVYPRRILGALLANLRAGRVVQGGSTLTQQLVKNFYLTRERTLGRKITEATMAILLERNHDKREILEAYLNEVYMGQQGGIALHGVGEAARFYFGSEVRDLSLAQGTLLAGMIRGPNLYSPFRHPERARERRDLVLGLLLEAGRITPEEHASAVSEGLDVRESPREDAIAPYFVEHVRQELAERLGQEILESEGLEVHTTLDPQLQWQAEGALRRGLARLEGRIPRLARPEEPIQGAIVVLAPESGEILAMVGGRDWHQSQFNRATRARRQPGSVFKPVVALAALAADAGPPSFTLASILEDQPLRVADRGRVWSPVNYDGLFRGAVTVREAIEQSINVPVARLGLAIGAERIVHTARVLGIESPLEPVPSLALGSFEITLLEAARAYAVLASGGEVAAVHGVREVVDAHGVVLEQHRMQSRRAVSPAEVYLVSSALRGVVDRGTGAGVRRAGFRGEVAGKTGTSNDFRDAWFVGFTPDLVIGVWIGFDDGTSLGLSGAAAAVPVFAELLLSARGSEGSQGFSRPSGLETVRIDPETGLRATFGCPGRPEIFLEGTAPRLDCHGREKEAWPRWLRWLRR